MLINHIILITVFFMKIHGEVCPPGRHKDGNVCADCEGGKYNDGRDNSKCEYCPPSHYSKSEATTCIECDENTGFGQYVVSRDYPATQKFNGYDMSTTHYFDLEPYFNDVVLSDKYGQRQINYGKVAKNLADNNNNKVFNIIDVQQSTRSKACSPCLGGYTRSKGVPFCNACPPGTFAQCVQAETKLDRYVNPITYGETTKTSLSYACFCKVCKANTYTDKFGLGRCATCPAGKKIKTEERNSNFVSYVKTGLKAEEAKYSSPKYFYTIEPSFVVNDPKVGNKQYYIALKSYEANVGCDNCPLGTYRGESDKECLFCPQGKFGNSVGLSECIVCPEGKYQNGEGAVSCLEAGTMNKETVIIQQTNSSSIWVIVILNVLICVLTSILYRMCTKPENEVYEQVSSEMHDTSARNSTGEIQMQDTSTSNDTISPIISNSDA